MFKVGPKRGFARPQDVLPSVGWTGTINLRIPAIHGAKTTSDPPGMFCLIDLQIFKRRSGCKIIKQTVPGRSDF